VVNVPAPVDGTIDQFMAEVGQHVSEGEVLARVRNPELAAAEQTAQLDAEQARNHLGQLESGLIAARLEVSRSEADATRVKLQLDQAEKTFQRQQMMFREGITARLTYEKAEQEYNSLKAESQRLESAVKAAADRVESITKELDPARKALAQKTNALEDAQAEAATGEVNSPTDGVVIAIHGKPGEPVTSALADLFQIAADPPALEAVTQVDSGSAARIHPGQTVEIAAAGVPGKFSATVREIKAGQLFIDIPSSTPQIKAGMTVQVKIN
jgi:HlyD family secretion protein